MEKFNYFNQVSAEKSMKSNPKETYDSLAKEIDGMIEKNVWQGVLKKDLSTTEKKSIIRSSAFIKKKLDTDENKYKFKARVVTDGSMQDRAIYKESDISSPTVKMSSIFTLAVMASAMNLKVQTSDISQAYLNAEMPYKVFVQLTKLVSEILCERYPEFKKFKRQRRKNYSEVK